MNRKLINFQIFPDLAHQAELEKHQGHIRLDRNFPFHGTHGHGRLTYDLNDKHWLPHIGINDPSNCKADTKNKGYQEKMSFDWKIQLEKVQLTRDLKDITILYQGIRLPCKMTKDIAILQHAHKQPLYGFLKKHAQFFK